MKIRIYFLIATLFTFISSAFAGDTISGGVTSVVSKTGEVVSAGMTQNYSTITLILLSILGVVIHTLSDMTKEQQRLSTKFHYDEYFQRTMIPMMLSLSICVGIILIRHELMQIPDFSKWEGFCMLMCGFCGRSIFIPFITNILKKRGIPLEESAAAGSAEAASPSTTAVDEPKADGPAQG